MNLCPICNLEVVAHTLNDDGAISQYIHAGGNSCSAERGLTPLALDAAKPVLKTNFTKQDVLNAIEVIFNTPRK